MGTLRKLFRTPVESPFVTVSITLLGQTAESVCHYTTMHRGLVRLHTMRKNAKNATATASLIPVFTTTSLDMVAASNVKIILMERNASCARKVSSRMNTGAVFLADAMLMEASLNNVMILESVTATTALMAISVTDARIIFTISLEEDAHHAIVTLRDLSTIGLLATLSLAIVCARRTYMEDNAKNARMALWDWRQTLEITSPTKIILLDVQLVFASGTPTAARPQRTTSRLLSRPTSTTMARIGSKWIHSLSNMTTFSDV